MALQLGRIAFVTVEAKTKRCNTKPKIFGVLNSLLSNFIVTLMLIQELPLLIIQGYPLLNGKFLLPFEKLFSDDHLENNIKFERGIISWQRYASLLFIELERPGYRAGASTVSSS